jgi:hypothetical protein
MRRGCSKPKAFSKKVQSFGERKERQREHLFPTDLTSLKGSGGISVFILWCACRPPQLRLLPDCSTLNWKGGRQPSLKGSSSIRASILFCVCRPPPLALLPVCSTLNWKGGRRLPLRAVGGNIPVGIVCDRHSDVMNSVKNRQRAQEPKQGSSPRNFYMSWICPSCNMVVWRENQEEAEVFCPFCSSGLPTYLNKVSPTRMIMRNERPQDHEVTASDANRQGTAPTEKVDRSSPFIHEFFLVQGSGFRCMAYRNNDGKWRMAFNDEVLTGAIRVLG